MALNKKTTNEETYVDEKTVEIAQEEAKDSPDFVTVYFKTPVKYNGEDIEQLDFDFDSLTGEDGLKIEKELMSIGSPAPIPVFSGEYLIRMAARACTKKIGVDIFYSMRLSDYNKIRSAARSFLLKSE